MDTELDSHIREMLLDYKKLCNQLSELGASIRHGAKNTGGQEALETVELKMGRMRRWL